MWVRERFTSHSHQIGIPSQCLNWTFARPNTKSIDSKPLKLHNHSGRAMRVSC